MDACLGVVMPVFNEAATILEVIGQVLAQPTVRELVIVDDASTDQTWQVMADVPKQDARVRLFRHEHNMGSVNQPQQFVKAGFQFKARRSTTKSDRRPVYLDGNKFETHDTHKATRHRAT